MTGSRTILKEASKGPDVVGEGAHRRVAKGDARASGERIEKTSAKQTAHHL